MTDTPNLPEWVEAAFGAALRKLRKEKGWSQERLAAESGLDRTYISLLERGFRSPSLTTISRLSGALGLSMSDVISSVEAEHKRGSRSRRAARKS